MWSEATSGNINTGSTTFILTLTAADEVTFHAIATGVMELVASGVSLFATIDQPQAVLTIRRIV
jgi:hypothetical protein